MHSPLCCLANLRFASPLCRYLRPAAICLAGGLLPFGSIFIEMYFVFTSFWNYKVRGQLGMAVSVGARCLAVTGHLPRPDAQPPQPHKTYALLVV